MSRKRGTFLLAEEMEQNITNERLSTKKELADQGKYNCPVPIKVRKSFRFRQIIKKPTPLCFNDNVTLSSMYDPNQQQSYLEQIFLRLGCVGEGSFGQVYKVMNKEDEKLYAVKRLKAHINFNFRCAEVKNNEMLKGNPYCVEYIMAWEENLDTFILFEYCDMSLADYSKLNNQIVEELLWNVLHDISKALEFLHNRFLLHLDIKPGNIMMKNGIFKLGDFGLLVDLQSDDKVAKSTLSDGDSKYLALEILEGIYTSACDIFGLGITIFELATDIELPEHGVLWSQLRHGFLPAEFYERVSSDLSIIVGKMIISDYKERPSAIELLNYPKILELIIRDNKLPRIDYAAQVMTLNSFTEKLTISPINSETSKESSTTDSTPPCNNKSPYIINSTSSPCRYMDDENRNIINCKKSLFSLRTVIPLSNRYLSPHNNTGNCSNFVDSGVECSNNDNSNSNSLESSASASSDPNKENNVSFKAQELVASSPLVGTRSRTIPKTKLNFD